MGAPVRGFADGSVGRIHPGTGRFLSRFGGGRGAGSKQWGGFMRLTVPLVASDATAGMIRIANPFGRTVYITRACLIVVTVDATETADIGVDADGATGSDILLDGVSLATAGIFDNLNDAGSNGKSRQPWASTQFVVGTASTGTDTIAGFFFVDVMDIPS